MGLALELVKGKDFEENVSANLGALERLLVEAY